MHGQWAELIFLATIGAALYVGVSLIAQRPLLKEIAATFVFR
jgi:hypothetical protein